MIFLVVVKMNLMMILAMMVVVVKMNLMMIMVIMVLVKRSMTTT